MNAQRHDSGKPIALRNSGRGHDDVLESETSGSVPKVEDGRRRPPSVSPPPVAQAGTRRPGPNAPASPGPAHAPTIGPVPPRR